MSDLSTGDFEEFQELNLHFSADPSMQSKWNPAHTMNPIATSYGFSPSTGLLWCRTHWCSMMGCNLHPAVKLCVPRKLTTVMLDLVVPPEAQVSVQSEMAVVGWLLPADPTSDRGKYLRWCF